MKTIIKIGLGVCLGFVLLIGGCAAVIGSAMDSGTDNDDKTFAERKSEDRKSEAKAAEKGTEAVAEADATSKPKPKPEPKLTAGQENALAQGDNYLSFSAFSRTGLIKQLKFEGYSTADATYAADNLTVNWNEQAAAKAEEYLDMSAFSRSGLIDQLEFEGFTTPQATYGVNEAGL